jgi:hypothetical protein
MIRSCDFLAAVLASAVATGCAKDSPSTPPADKSPTEPTSATAEVNTGTVDATELAQSIGVEPGGWVVDDSAGAEAVVSSGAATVEVRRVGEEQFAAGQAEPVQLFAGDQVRTGVGASAVVTMADETVIELAADSAIAIGERDASPLPASSAAVLYGVARFTVSERGPGEGSFVVYTPAGMVATVGTVYGVGVTASGDARVGVESGSVEIAAIAALDNSIVLKGGQAATLHAAGTAPSSSEFKSDDWGAWRDAAEADLTPAAVAEAHVAAIVTLEADTGSAYADLERLTTAVVEIDAKAEEAATANDSAGYAAVAPELSVSVEASYLAALRLQQLSYSMLARAYLTRELYVRHPTEVEPVYTPAAPQISASVLWHKKFHAVARAHVTPLRGRFYRHHPEGRTHAAAAGTPVPAFYGAVKLKPVVRADLAARVSAPVFRPPQVAKRNKAKKVWRTAPEANWHASVKARPAAARGPAWYVAPPAPRARLVVGAEVKAKGRTFFPARPPAPRPATVRIAVDGADVTARARGRVEVGKVGAPKAELRGKAKLEAKGRPAVPGAAAHIKAQAGSKAIDGAADIDAKAKAGLHVRGQASGHGKATVDPPQAAVRAKTPGAPTGRAGAGLDVKKPATPETPKPAVKAKGSVKVEGKAGVKLGN